MAIKKERFYEQSRFSDFRIHAYRDSRTGECHVTAVTVNDELLIPTRTFWVQLAELFGGENAEIPFGGEYALADDIARVHGDVQLVYRVTHDGQGNQLLSGVKLPTPGAIVGGIAERMYRLAEHRFSIRADNPPERDWPLLRSSTLDDLLDGIDEIPLTRRFTMSAEPSPGFAPSPEGCLRPSLN